MAKPKILLQLDPDPQPSVFDAVVAIDAGAEQLLRHGGVTVDNVEGLVHGAMFTRGPDDLASTAIFIGGSQVGLADALAARVAKCFFGPLRVSVLVDANGANTTAAAAVLAAARHQSLAGAECLVLGGTGPVGQRAARLLAREGARVRLASRSLARAEQAAAAIRSQVDGATVVALETLDQASTATALAGASVLIAAGAAGAELVSAATLAAAKALRVAVDLNAVPPVGIATIDAMDKAQDRDGVSCYGALGVGGTKMKIHKEAIRRLFTRNDLLLDAEQVLAIGKSL